MRRDPLTPSGEVHLPLSSAHLTGNLEIPDPAQGIVVFAHGSGSSRMSPRNGSVARRLRDAGLATLLTDLLTPEEEALDLERGHLRFDIALLAGRLLAVTDWLTRQGSVRSLPLGYFGASTGAGAALLAAAERGDAVRAVVSRGGRPDLAGPALHRVTAPTLLIVGGADPEVLELNRAALAHLRCDKQLRIVPGASHLFPEPGALEEVARLAAAWFRRHFGQPEWASSTVDRLDASVR
ncbi:MAG: dienelactone hydrolase family protein, partial [Thermoanaerobaculia bacterium]